MMDDNIRPFIQKCLAGDSASWEMIASIVLQILRHQYPALSPEDHEDLVQDVNLKLHANLSTFRGAAKAEFLYYLRISTIRETISHHRRTARHRGTVSLEEPIGEVDCDETLHNIVPTHRLGPEKIIEINDLYRKAAAHLSPRDQQILMCKAQEYQDQTIAEFLGMPTSKSGTLIERRKSMPPC